MLQNPTTLTMLTKLTNVRKTAIHRLYRPKKLNESNSKWLLTDAYRESGHSTKTAFLVVG